MIKTSYDPEADVFAAHFGPPEARSDGHTEVAPGVFIEYDTEGNVIGLEILPVLSRAANAASTGEARSAAE